MEDGVWQGCTLTPWLFDVFSDTTLKEVGNKRGHCCVEVGNRKLESVKVVKYLGLMINGDGRIEKNKNLDWEGCKGYSGVE